MPVDNSKYILLPILSTFREPEKIIDILTKAKFNILQAKDEEEASVKVVTTTPDMILLDIDESARTGNSVLEKLKKNKITRSIPVLLIAAAANESHIPECLIYDHIDFIIKPFRPQELVIRVQHQLSLLHAERTIRRQNQKLKQTLEARDKLYSVIAHDLRAPIGTLKMINSSLESKKSLIEAPEVLKLFEMINETTEEAFNLLENLLRWTRNQNGKTKIYASTFNITTVIRQVVSLFTTIAHAKDIRLNNYIQNPHYIYADEDMIKTVLRNLISNAIKFTYTGGKVDIYLSENDKEIQVSIADNGKGIPKETQTHLLKADRFITTYGTHNEKGSGLGLSLCKDFIKMNKGKLSFTSQEGIGTTFHFTIPKAPCLVS